MSNKIQGKDITIGTRIKTWFMPGGTAAVCIDAYRGPLQDLFPNGARIIGFNAVTRAGVMPMTVDSDAWYDLA